MEETSNGDQLTFNQHQTPRKDPILFSSVIEALQQAITMYILTSTAKHQTGH